MIVIKLVFLSILPIINAIIGRCYLCSQDTLPECIGSNQLNSSIYINVLQYHTEPCNGQCVLFRNKNHSIIRGCSWTYGHMTRKTIGWHEISPGINAYFCNSYLCNNGTYEQPEISKWILSPEQLFLLATNNPLPIEFNIYEGYLSHQCYSCTARFQGCGEFLDPHYASKYIRPCPSSCILFRNPNDLNLITRDCGIFWPQVHVKSGFHKLLGTDAFFCQESLCNGISFDFIMSIFHNQLPTIIKFPPISNTSPSTTINIYNDNVIWDDDDLDDDDDDDLIESTTPIISNNSTSSSNTTAYFEDKSLFNNNTIVGNLSDLNATSFSLSSINTSSIPSITRFEHLFINDSIEEINQTDENVDNMFSSTTPIIDLFTFIPYYFFTNQTKNQLYEYIKPLSPFVIPPFSWMLSMAAQNKNQFLNSTIIPTTITTTTTTTKSSDIFYEYCKNKQCHHHGHLNSDCLCICLPTFTGDNCETVLCEDEPPHICAFILEHECQTNYIRYLCPKFCELDICTSNKT